MLHSDVTEAVIQGFFKVYNTLGYGFLEKIYENALHIELEKTGLSVTRQHPIRVLYEGQHVGEYYTDLVVNDVVIIELKAHEQLKQEHAAQVMNYLKATRMEVGLLLNFGKKPDVRRIVLTTG